jgi:lipopolysaccharide assembly outer membrane protein LptD (OstA)
LKANRLTSALAFFSLFGCCGTLLAQQRTDTVRHTLPADTVLHAPAQKPLDAPVTYEATDSLIFTNEGYAYLYGSGKTNYTTIELTAEVISVNIDSSTVHAHGIEDSLGVIKGRPVFKDGDTPYETDNIRYNLKSRRGLISNVISQQGEGYVVAHNAKKGANDELFTTDGKYTTCDNHEHPHFYIQMTYAKVRPKKNIVTGPAYFVVEDVPLPLAVPFFFFPFNDKFSSGFIMPTYMDDSSRGFGLTNGGYYFAMSDRMDLKLRGDIYTKGSWALNAESNYNVRYRFSGLFQASYQVTKTGDKGLSDYQETKDYKIVWSHRQDPKANPNTTFSASVNFASSSYEKTNVGNLYNQQAASQNTKTSSISYTRSFPDLKLNISATTNIAQTTRDSSVAVTLPDLNISLSTIYPFKRKKAVGDERWYEKIQFRYTGRFSNSITTKDNLLFKSNIVKDWKNGAKHDIPISATFTLFNYFNLTPSISYNARWYTRRSHRAWNQETQREMRTDTTYGFYHLNEFSGSLGLNTKIYAMYRPVFMKKKEIQIRHVITPTVSISARPDFSASMWGYYDTYVKRDRNGVPIDTIQYSPYSDGMFGVPSSGKSGSVTFDLSNNVEVKYRDRNDSLVKRSILDELGGSLSYNMAAKQRPWGDLNLRARIKLSQSYTFSLNSVFRTYGYEFDRNGNVVPAQRTEWSYGRFGIFQGYSTSFSHTFNNESWSKIKAGILRILGKGDEAEETERQAQQTAGQEEEAPQVGSIDDTGAPPKRKKVKAQADSDGYQEFKMPWSFNINYGISISEDTSKPINRHSMRYPYKLTHTLSGSGNLKISNKWSFSFNASYDFTAKKIATTAVNISRDLHCFNLSAAVAPFGVYKYYNFTIRANASILQDLKWDQRSQTQSNIQWY